MNIRDLPADLLAACIARAVDGDIGALVRACSACPAFHRCLPKALASLEHAVLRAASRRPGQELQPDLLRELTAVRLLDLSHQGVIGYEHLAAIGAHARRLRRLRLYNCLGVTGESLSHLVQLPCLEALDLRFCQRASGAQALQRMAGLTELRVSWCPEINSALLQPLAASLRVLEARSCALDDSICPLLTSCEELDLAYTGITDAGLHALAQHARKLRQLVVAEPVANVWPTGNWTEAGLAAFQTERPDVAVHLTA